MTGEVSCADDGMGLEKTALTIGFVPLSDCAPLVVAKEKGFFREHGLDVELSRETSWASIRDKTAYGMLDAAQMLASMPITSSLGIGPLTVPMVTALSLDLNGNAITVSEDLYQRLCAANPGAMRERPLSATALGTLVRAERSKGYAPLTFAVVFPTSTHTYELRYWMAAAGIDPDHDVRLVVVPPSQMVEALRRGQIDGFCVGEPWSQLAVRQGLGRVLITKYELWNNSPEKVLGVTADWAQAHPNTHRALLVALIEAAAWVDRPEHRMTVVDILAQRRYVDAPAEAVRMSMLGTFQYARTEFSRSLPDFNVFHRYAANFPWCSHAVWLITQMQRWGQLGTDVDVRAVAEQVYQPGLYREAARVLGLACPPVDYKTEGEHACVWEYEGVELGPDRFFDGGMFDPLDATGYLQRQLAADRYYRSVGGAENLVDPDVPRGGVAR